MPVSYVYFPDRPLMFTTGSGVITDEELLAHWQAGYADKQIQWGAPELLDLRAVERFEVTASGLRKLVDLDTKYAKGAGAPSKLAVIAPADNVFGMIRMYQMFSDLNPNSVHVFRDLSGVAEWLGTSLPET